MSRARMTESGPSIYMKPIDKSSSADLNTQTSKRSPGSRAFILAPLLIFIFAMLVTNLPRMGAMRWGKPALSAAGLSAKRTFFFSARTTQNQQNAGAKGPETGWTDPGSADAAAASAANSALSTAYNYDKTSFDKLLSYQIAVSFQPKNREETNVFKRKSSAPAPATLSPSGEDNLFVSAQGEDGYIAVGVADGVGGWAEAGYDSSAISRELCHAAKTSFEKTPSKTGLSPKELLSNAFHEIQGSPKVEIGGTTACFGVLTPDRKLRVANLGDSWCGVFRNHKLVEETSFQTHNFNTPYQLAKIPKQILRQAELQGKRYIIDTPDMCDEYAWDLQKDDVVVFATDGVTDNVIPQDIEIFLKDQFAQQKPLSEVSSQLVKEVVKVSKDPNYPSAFAQELSRLTGQRYMGGKEDDVTVVMIKVL